MNQNKVYWDASSAIASTIGFYATMLEKESKNEAVRKLAKQVNATVKEILETIKKEPTP